MTLPYWTLAYAADLAWWLWVVKGGGAEWLEGTFASGFLIDMFAPRWTAAGIKLFGYVAVAVSTVIFVLGIFCSGVRG